METQSTREPVSKGTCTFCETEVAKNKMTQHLKFCKKRLATIAAQEKQPQETKTRLFHILAEGKYSPGYWLHFEVPASESLWSLDSFIKDMWIDDLDHLSGFTINDTHYNTEYPSEFFSLRAVQETEEEEEISEEEQEQEIREYLNEVIANAEEFYASYLELLSLPAEAFAPEWVAELRKPCALDEFRVFLKEEQTRITKEYKDSWRKDKEDVPPKVRMKRQQALQYQKMIVEELLEALEGTGMDVKLQHVLKVGQKFSYVYDFGSSTYVNLKVIAEREGIITDEKEPVRLLARNIVETFPCAACGKPATTVEMGYFWDSIAESSFCTNCAKEHIDEERRLPIINSPRVGVL